MSIRQDLELEIAAALDEVQALGAALNDAFTTGLADFTAGLGTAADALAAALTDAVAGTSDQLAQTVGIAGDSLAGALTTAADAGGAAVSDSLTAAIDAAAGTAAEALTTAGTEGAQATADVLQSEVAAALTEAASALGTVDWAGDVAGLSAAVGEGVTAGLEASNVEVLGPPLVETVATAIQDGFDNASQDAGGLDSIGAAGQAAGGKAAEGLGKAEGAARGVEIAVAGASGGIGALGGAAKSLLPAGAAIAAIGLGVGELAHAAENAQTAQVRFNSTFGDLGKEVKEVDIGGLTGNVDELGLSIGATGAQVNTALTFIGKFGKGAGASGEEIKGTTQTIAALALQAVALNPALGSFDSATQRLTGALITGRAKALVPFGLSLDKTAVAAKAQELALADGRTEVTKFDSAAAGAALAATQLGTGLGKNFATGAQLAQTKFAALKAQIEEGLVKAGTPLLGPLLDAAQRLTPLAIGLATGIGALFRVVVPLADILATGLSDAVNATVSGFQQISSALAPVGSALGVVAAPVGALIGVLSTLNDILGGVPGHFTELLLVFGTFGAVLSSTVLPALARAGTAFISFVDGAVVKLGASLPSASAAVTTMAVEVEAGALTTEAALAGVPAAAAAMGAGVAVGAESAVVGLSAVGPAAETAATEVVVASETAAASNPFGWVIAGVGLLVAAFGLFHHSHKAAEVDVTDFTGSLAKEQLALAGAGAAAASMSSEVASALAKTKGFKDFGAILEADSGRLKHALADVGLGSKQMAADLGNGQKGLEDYIAHFAQGAKPPAEFANRLRAAGVSTAQLAHGLATDGEATGKFVAKLVGGNKAFLLGSSASDKYARSLVFGAGAFSEAQKAQKDYYTSQINALSATIPLTAAQEKQLKAGKDLAGLYVTLTHAQEKQAEKQAQEQTDTFAAAGGWNTLAQAVIAAGGSYANLPDIAGSDKLDPKAVQAFAKGVSDALAGVVSDVQSTLPTAGTVIGDWASNAQDAFKTYADAVASGKSTSKELKADQAALVQATDPQTLIDNINKQAKAVADFSGNVGKLFASGNVRAAQEALKLGPTAGAAYAQSLVAAGPQVEAGANTALLGLDKANNDLTTRVQTQWGPQIIGAYGQVAQQADGSFAFNLANPAAVNGALQANLGNVAKNAGVLSPQFAAAGQALGLNLTQSYLVAVRELGPSSVQGAKAAAHAFLAAAPGLGSAGAKLGVDIVQSFGGAMSTISSTTAAKVAGISLEFTKATPGMSEAARASALQGTAPLVDGLSHLPAHGTTAMQGLIAMIRAEEPNLSASAAEAAARAAVGINGLVPTFQHAGSAAGAAATGAIDAAAPGIGDAGSRAGHGAGSKTAEGVGEGVKSGQSGITTAAGTTVQAALSALDAAKLSVQVGWSFDEGLARGINQFGFMVSLAAAAVVTQAEIAARTAADSHSPSKLFAKVGEDLTRGLAEGIGTASSLPVTQVRSLVGHLVNEATGTALSEMDAFAKQAADHVLGVANRSLQHNLGVLKGRADALMNRAALDSVKAVGQAVTSLGPGARFGLTTGAVNLSDVVQPVASSIDRALKGFGASLNHDIDLAGSAMIKTLNALTSEEQKRLDAFRKTGTITAPTVAAFATPVSAPARAQAVSSILPAAGQVLPVSASFAIDIHLPAGFTGTPAEVRAVSEGTSRAVKARLAELNIAALMNGGQRTGA